MPFRDFITPTVIDGLLLLGLIAVVDRKNANRHFPVTVLVAFVLVTADALMHRFLLVALGWFVEVLSFALRVVLLWKVAEVQVRRAVVITAVFEVLIVVVEPMLILLALSSSPGH